MLARRQVGEGVAVVVESADEAIVGVDEHGAGAALEVRLAHEIDERRIGLDLPLGFGGGALSGVDARGGAKNNGNQDERELQGTRTESRIACPP